MNSKRDGSDPRPLIALVAGIAVFSAWRLLSNLAVPSLSSVIASATPIALGATAIALALTTQRLVATRRALRRRRTVALVPADEFDAGAEAVLRFAAQLTQPEHSLTRWIDRRARALRIRLTSDCDGRLVYLLEAREQSLATIRSALRTYEGVELRDVDSVLGAAGEEAVDDVGDPDREDEAEWTVLRTELVLARPSIEPLERLQLDPDPLQPFAAALASLAPKQGDRASVCIDLLPAAGLRSAWLQRRLRRQARSRHRRRGPSLAELLGARDGSDSAHEPAELVERRDVLGAVGAKLRDSGALFEAQVLLRVEASSRPRAKVTMQTLLAAFAPLAGRNWLRVSGLAIPGVGLLFGSDFILRRRSFERRHRTGFFRPARRTILTARELAGFMKPPTEKCRAENVLRSGALLAPAPPLPSFERGSAAVIPLGRVAGETGERMVGVRAADSFFSYIAGRSRYGKTELAIAQFVHLVRSGNGGLFLDPHGDALERIKPYLSGPEVARRVVEIDLGPGSVGAAQPGWNLFELRGRSAGETEARVESVVDAFASALEWGDRSTRAINLTTQAASALAAVARMVPAEIAPTIFQIPTLLTDEKWREAALPFLPSAAQRFWVDRFGRLSEEAITPVTNMIDRLRASSAATTLLGQSESSYRARDAMDRGLIVLACPGSGGTRDRLLANLIVFDLFHAAMSRGQLPPEQRKVFYACLDEIQTFDGGSGANLAALIEQTAKFGLRGIFLNQNPERLSASTLNALTTNRSHLIATALNSHAAGLLTKEWGGEVSPVALPRLPRYRFIAQVTHKGELSKPFALGGIRVDDLYNEPTAAKTPRSQRDSTRECVARRRSSSGGSDGRQRRTEKRACAQAGTRATCSSGRRHGGTPVARRRDPSDVHAHQERLDGAILGELRRLAKSGGAGLEPEPAPRPPRSLSVGRRRAQ